VINCNGDTVRSFSYADGLTVTHSDALGLGCHYRCQTQGGKPAASREPTTAWSPAATTVANFTPSSWGGATDFHNL